MDGASTDDTTKIAQSYNDSRIRIYSEPDKGIYDAMNKGILKAKGEWTYFLGSDDWLIHEGVLHNVFSQDINDYDVVYGDVDAPHLASAHSGAWSLETVDYNRCHQAILYKRAIFKRLGMYNLKYKIWADYDLNLKWFFDRKLKNKYIPIKIAHYSEGGFSCYQLDSELLDKLPWLKLVRGRHAYTCAEKKKIIAELLKNKWHSLKQKVMKIGRSLNNKQSDK